MVVGQKSPSAGPTPAPSTIYVTDTTLTFDPGDDTRTIAPRTTTAVRNIKSHRPRKAAL